MTNKSYQRTAICPICHSDDIEDIDIIDLEGAFVGDDNEDGLLEYHVGKCRKCGAELSWKRAYKFCGIADVQGTD